MTPAKTRQEQTATPPDPRPVLEAQIKALETWAEALPCQRPVRMMKHAVDGGTGEIAAEGKEVLLRCGTRQINRCPPCAALYRGDARAVIYEGLRTAIEAAEQVIFLTLTAPSFGETHRVPPTPSPRMNRRQRAAWEKRYHRPCPCGQTHAPGDRRWTGLPLRPSLYDYAGQVRWNSQAGRLWSRTADELSRVLGVERLVYAGTAEWQSRGAIHLHLILRVPAGADLDVESDRSRLIERTVRGVATFTGPNRSGDRITWGPQTVAEVIGTERKAFRTAGYLAKLVGYAVKDLSNGDDRSTRAAVMQRHHQRLTQAAEQMTCGQTGSEREALCRYRSTGQTAPGSIPVENARRQPCRSLRHKQWGWRGHVLRRSRSWAALTMTECRRRRSEFGKLQREAEGFGPHEDEALLIWLRPQDGSPMQVEEPAWPRLRDGALAELRSQLLVT